MINFYCPINQLGYGIHSFNLLKALDKKGIELALYPPNNTIDSKDTLVDKWLNNQKRFSKEDIGVMIFHENYMNRFYGRVRIGFPVFEVGLRPQDIEMLKTLDIILQASDYHKSYLNNLGFNNIFVVPEGYDPNVFKFDMVEISKKERILEERGVVFSHIGKLEERKSSLDILKTFTFALLNTSVKCTLIASMFNPFLPDWLEVVKECLGKLDYIVQKEDSATIVFAREMLKIIVLKCRVRDVREIYASSHFGIYASKAEGWNLPLIESIAFGLPCITSDWTGQSEYLKSYPKELIITEGESVVANDGKWFFGDRGNWTSPDLSSLKEILKKVVSSPAQYLNLAKKCYDSVSAFTWESSANIFINVLKDKNLL